RNVQMYHELDAFDSATFRELRSQFYDAHGHELRQSLLGHLDDIVTFATGVWPPIPVRHSTPGGARYPCAPFKSPPPPPDEQPQSKRARPAHGAFNFDAVSDDGSYPSRASEGDGDDESEWEDD